MSSPALIVIDAQRAFDDPAWGQRNNRACERNITQALAGWRRNGAPVLHIRHASRGRDGLFIPGTRGFDFKAEALPRDGEAVFTKYVNSAFIGTELEDRLRERGIEAVAFAGLTTDHCCSTTARMSANLGFDTWVLADAMATFDRQAPSGETIAAEVVHRVSLASLHNEFAEVLETEDALARLQKSRSSTSP